MSAGRAHDLYRQLVAGHALSALEPADDLELAAHLQGCPDCRRLLVELSGTAAELAYTVSDVDPPPEILDNLRLAIAADVASQDGVELAPDALAPVVAPAFGSAPAERARSRNARRRVSISMPVWALGAAAVALVVFAATMVGVRMHSDSTNREHTLAAYTQMVDSVAQPGTHLVPLTSSGGPARGTAVVAGRKVYLVSSDLGINDASDSTYVLWVQSANGGMVAVGKFDVTHNGPSVYTATVPSRVAHPSQFAVSEESGLRIPVRPSDQVLASANV